MKRRNFFILAAVFGIILISNIPLISVFIGMVTTTESMKSEIPQFVSGSGNFATTGAYLKGGTPEHQYNDLLRQFNAYKAENPGDTTLYRTFKSSPLFFWRWYRDWKNRYNPFYQLPYKKYKKD
ncbi:hypothetical protein [Dyadobacter sp. OTU695]|uniref:hypothetical protein n=1 Tax=Dyadobacter sp. OTU695 TaxID=3043860 RepID=UPI00313C608E